MRRLLLALVALVCLAGAPGAGATPPRYLLTLGDELAASLQPNAAGQLVATDSGYPDRLLSLERRRIPGLTLVKGGCAGVGPANMRRRAWGLYLPRCWGGRTELAWVTGWLAAHHDPGEVPLITVALGVGAPRDCLWRVPGPCLTAQTTSMAANLPVILRALRRAAPAGTTIAMMTDYDPALGLSLTNPGWTSGYVASTLRAVQATNAVIAADGAHAGVRIADVAGAFHLADTRTFTRYWLWPLAYNVGVTCAWTWSCRPTFAVPPHMNPLLPAPTRLPPWEVNENGAAVIAATFARAAGSLAG